MLTARTGMRVLHVITGLNLGGAETMLYRLLRASHPGPSAYDVVSLTDRGIVGERIEAMGIPVRALGMRRTPDPRPLLRLARFVARTRPDVVQTWMYHADLVGGVAAALARNAKIAWGIHHSTVERAHARRTTRLAVALGARLSPWIPDRIVAVSRAARDLHVDAGYDARKFVVIPNGFDMTEFRQEPGWRREVRRELGVADHLVLIGLVARVDPQKDHVNFLRAAAVMARRRSEVRFLLCGKDATRENGTLLQAVSEHGLGDRVLLLGPRTDIPRIMNALDIATLSSAWGEAFPLVIGEAMACGVPCVVTDVGDSAYLVGDTGRVVRPRDPEELAAGWEALVELGPDGRRLLGGAARARIEQHFSLPRIAAEYASLYRRMLDGVPEPSAGTVAGA
jgi:glycosyltransferase involved in cell wall biosynthesis